MSRQHWVEQLKTQWRQFDRTLDGQVAWLEMRPGRYNLLRHIRPLVERYARGRVLDVGAGSQRWRSLIEPCVERYVALDIGTDSGLHVRGDAQTLPFDTASFDTVLCVQVLGEVADAGSAAREFARVLRPQGYLLLSVPQVWPAHQVKPDYHRFTRLGIEHMLQRTGLVTRELLPLGGLATFMGDVLASLAMAPMWRLAATHRFLRTTNRLATTGLHGLDRLADPAGALAEGFAVVAQRA